MLAASVIQRELLGWVSQPAAHDARGRRVGMLLRLRSPEDVGHQPPFRLEYVCYEGAVAAPPHGFRAHDRGALTSCKCLEFTQPARELFARDVIGVAAKAFVPPAGVRRIRDWTSASTQGREPDVVQPRGVERAAKCQVREVRMSPGPRKSSHVGDSLHLVSLEQLEEHGLGERRVTDRPDGRVRTSGAGAYLVGGRPTARLRLQVSAAPQNHRARS